MTTVISGLSQADADARFQAQWTITDVTPTNGQIIVTSTANGSSLLLTLSHTGTIASLTINMPSNPKLGMFFEISTVGTVTALTLAAPGMMITNPPAQLAIGDYVSYRYTKANVWMRRI